MSLSRLIFSCTLSGIVICSSVSYANTEHTEESAQQPVVHENMADTSAKHEHKIVVKKHHKKHHHKKKHHRYEHHEQKADAGSEDNYNGREHEHEDIDHHAHSPHVF